jgi:DNA-binding PadR family transcriptional regulator
MAGELTTTSYAILGLLAVKPWTTYELAQQMDRAIGLFWPRTRSKLYEEPKKLVAHGLARASSESVGRRPRTVYSITPKGRRALAAWTKTASDPPVLEWDLLLKVFFAEHGSKEDLLATLNSMSEWLEASARNGAAICRAYLDGKGPFPERLPWIMLVGQFLDDFNAMVEHWTEWAAGVVEKWPDDVRAAEPDLAVLELMARSSEERLDRSALRRAAEVVHADYRSGGQHAPPPATPGVATHRGAD